MEGDRLPPATMEAAGGGNNTNPTGDDGGGTTTPGTDAGTTAAADGGGGDDGGATSALQPFKTAGAYASNQPATSAQTSHANAGQPAQTPTTDCLTCHVTGGAAVPFLAAGFVATAANGTTGAANVQVGVYNATLATSYIASTDANGFFWMNPPNGGATGTFCGGVRSATQETDMPTTQTTYDCQSSSCHGANPIHSP